MFHTELADLFHFLGLKGFYKWQKTQMYEEAKCLDELKCHTIFYHQCLLNIKEAKEPDALIDAKWYEKSTADVVAADLKAILPSVLNAYITRETSVITAFDEIKSQLTIVNDKEFVKNLIKNTECELAEVKHLKQKLDLTNYDISCILKIAEEKDK